MDYGATASAVATDQKLVAGRRQLYAAGVPRWYVANELRRRRWQRGGRQTVVLHNGPVDQQAQWWIAVLEVGCRAALDGVCALQAAGIKALRDTDIVVATPKGSTPCKPPGVRVRETRRFRSQDVIMVGIPRMRPATAAVHAALWAMSDRQARLFVLMTVQQRLAAPADVVEVIATIRRHLRRRMLRELAAELLAGSQTLGELDVAGALRARGLPTPSRQSVRTRPNGTQYLDLEWPDFRLVLEIDGLGHEAPAQAVSDWVRDLTLLAEGSNVMRLKMMAWLLDREAVLDALETVFRSRGWSPSVAA
jgi:very-short-patch-repair endonuclease